MARTAHVKTLVDGTVCVTSAVSGGIMRTGHIKTLPDGTVCVTGAGQYATLGNLARFDTIAGTLVETILKTITVPANTLDANSHLFIQTLAGGISGGVAYYIKVRIGGIAGTIVAQCSGGPAGERPWVLETYLSNRNLINSQMGIHRASSAGTMAVTNLATAINFAVAQDIVVTGQTAVGTTVNSYYLFAGYVP